MAKRQRVGGRSTGGDFPLQQDFDPARWVHVDEAALPKTGENSFSSANAPSSCMSTVQTMPCCARKPG